MLACGKELSNGKEATASLLERKPWRLERVCRSSLSAECQAMAEALDNLNFLKMFWGILIGNAPPRCRLVQDVFHPMPLSLA